MFFKVWMIFRVYPKNVKFFKIYGIFEGFFRIPYFEYRETFFFRSFKIVFHFFEIFKIFLKFSGFFTNDLKTFLIKLNVSRHYEKVISICWPLSTLLIEWSSRDYIFLWFLDIFGNCIILKDRIFSTYLEILRIFPIRLTNISIFPN